MAFYLRLVRLRPYFNHRQFSAIAKPDSEANKQKIRSALSFLETKKKKTISSAEQILYLALSDAGSTFPHTSDSLSSFLHELKTQPSLLCSLVDELKALPDLQKDRYFSHFISLYLEAEMFDNAIQTFKDMTAMEIYPTTLSLNMLLRACLHKNTASEVLKLFNELYEDYDITTDIETYNILLEGFVPLGYYNHREAIFSLLEQLDDTDFGPDETTTDIFMDGLQQEKLEDAAQVVQDLVNKDIRLLDTRVYNFGVTRLCELKKTSEAQKLFNDLSHNFGIDDVETYNSLLEAYITLGYYNHRETIFSILEQMENEDCEPDDVTSNVFMDALHKEKLEDAAQVIVDMVDRDIQLLDSRVYHYGVEGLCKLKKTSEALNLFETVTSWDDLEPNVDIYQRIIQLCCEEGKLEELNKVHRDMRDNVKTETYQSCSGTLIETLCKYGHYETAKAWLFEWIDAKDLKLNDAAYMNFINVCDKEGKVEEVVKLYHEMQEKEKGIEPYRNSYKTIIKLLIGRGDTENALQVCKHCMGKEWFQDFFFSSDETLRKSLFSLVTGNAKF